MMKRAICRITLFALIVSIAVAALSFAPPSVQFAAAASAKQDAPQNLFFRVNGTDMLIPVKGMAITGCLSQSILFTPEDVVRDGLPHFGSMRGDLEGKPRKHEGIDIYAKDGHMVIVACADGLVTKVVRNPTAGLYVKLDHGNGLQTVYVHLTESFVSVGESVKSGQVIGRVDGPSGNAIAPQLHFELQVGEGKVDPIPYVAETYKKMPDGKTVASMIAKAAEEFPARIAARKALVEEYLKRAPAK